MMARLSKERGYGEHFEGVKRHMRIHGVGFQRHLVACFTPSKEAQVASLHPERRFQGWIFVWAFSSTASLLT
jgi:hypothetical protein